MEAPLRQVVQLLLSALTGTIESLGGARETLQSKVKEWRTASDQLESGPPKSAQQTDYATRVLRQIGGAVQLADFAYSWIEPRLEDAEGAPDKEPLPRNIRIWLVRAETILRDSLSSLIGDAPTSVVQPNSRSVSLLDEAQLDIARQSIDRSEMHNDRDATAVMKAQIDEAWSGVFECFSVASSAGDDVTSDLLRGGEERFRVLWQRLVEFGAANVLEQAHDGYVEILPRCKGSNAPAYRKLVVSCAAVELLLKCQAPREGAVSERFGQLLSAEGMGEWLMEGLHNLRMDLEDGGEVHRSWEHYDPTTGIFERFDSSRCGELERRTDVSIEQLAASSVGFRPHSGRVRNRSSTRDNWLINELLRIRGSVTKLRTTHGDLRHYLVIPAGESLLDISEYGVRPVGISTGRRPRRVSFGADEIAAPTLPKSFWPKSLSPAWGFSVEDGENVLRNHLFFGDRNAIRSLRQIAKQLQKIEGDIHRITAGGVLFICDGTGASHYPELDEILTSGHIWAWRRGERSFTRKIVVNGRAHILEYDDGFEMADGEPSEHLTFSCFDTNVFEAVEMAIEATLHELPGYQYATTISDDASGKSAAPCEKEEVKVDETESMNSSEVDDAVVELEPTTEGEDTGPGAGNPDKTYAQVQPLDIESKDWIHVKDLKRFGETASRKSLTEQRSRGRKTDDELGGIDEVGRHWRKPSATSRAIYYLRSTLQTAPTQSDSVQE